MTGEPESGLLVQAVGEFVGARLAFASVGAPAGGIVPAVTVTGGVHVDGILDFIDPDRPYGYKDLQRMRNEGLIPARRMACG